MFMKKGVYVFRKTRTPFFIFYLPVIIRYKSP